MTLYRGRESGREVAVVSATYTLLPGPAAHFCPCPAFNFSVLGGRGASHCKHLLALRCVSSVVFVKFSSQYNQDISRLGLAMGKVTVEEVDEQRVRLMLEELA